MTRTIFVLSAAALALTACQDKTPPPENSTTAVEANAEANAIGNAGGNAMAENVTATVVAMPEAQRNIVFVRALMDAGLPCEGVEKSVRLDDMNGLPLWRAECKGGAAHMITITPDGTANIVSRNDR